MKRRTEITIQSKRLTLIRRVGNATRAWCSFCEKQVEMLTPDQAAVQFRLSTRLIHRMVDEGKVHLIETPDGLLLICVDTLASQGYQISR